MNNLPTPSAEVAVAAQLEAKYKAACNLPLLLDMIVKRAYDPTASAKQVLDTAEFAYKVSGMAAKQAEKATGSGFSIVIRLPSATGSVAQEITIGSGAAESDPEFPVAPEWIQQLDVVEEF